MNREFDTLDYIMFKELMETLDPRKIRDEHIEYPSHIRRVSAHNLDESTIVRSE